MRVIYYWAPSERVFYMFYVDAKTEQGEFALMIGVSVATLRNWEQGRRTPDGPALALLRVAARNPKAVVPGPMKKRLWRSRQPSRTAG